jgi:hypothetical protein
VGKSVAASAAAADPSTPPTEPSKPARGLIEEAEKAIQAGLTGIHLYAAQVHRALLEAVAADCDPWQRNAAKRAKEYARAQIITMATERKQSIERYEDALSSVVDIAGEK